MPSYSPDWGEVAGTEHLLMAASIHAEPLMIDRAASGDLIVFRWHRDAIAKHVGILTAANRFIHAWERGGVVEVALTPSWQRRIAAAFRFPAVEEVSG